MPTESEKKQFTKCLTSTSRKETYTAKIMRMNRIPCKMGKKSTENNGVAIYDGQHTQVMTLPGEWSNEREMEEERTIASQNH